MIEDHDDGERLTVRLPASASSVSIGRRAAAQFAEETDCSERTRWRVRLAVSLTLSSTVLPANRRDSAAAGQLTLTARTHGDRLTVTVTDAGMRLRARAEAPALGLALALIAKCCDEIEVETGAVVGTTVNLTFIR